MFCQRCGRRVKANFIRNVMKCDRIVVNVTKYTWSVTKSDKTRQNTCFSRSAVEGSTQISFWIVQNVTKYMWNVIESHKMQQNACFVRSAAGGWRQISLGKWWKTIKSYRMWQNACFVRSAVEGWRYILSKKCETCPLFICATGSLCVKCIKKRSSVQTLPVHCPKIGGGREEDTIVT